MNRYVLALSFVSSLALAFSAGCSSSSGNAGGCFETQGSGSTMTCVESNEVNGSCPSPAMSGSCPTSGLYGCCIATSDGESAGSCFYSSTVGATAKAACKSPDMWTTSP